MVDSNNQRWLSVLNVSHVHTRYTDIITTAGIWSRKKADLKSEVRAAQSVDGLKDPGSRHQLLLMSLLKQERKNTKKY